MQSSRQPYLMKTRVFSALGNMKKTSEIVISTLPQGLKCPESGAGNKLSGFGGSIADMFEDYPARNAASIAVNIKGANVYGCCNMVYVFIRITRGAVNRPVYRNQMA